MRSTMRWAGLAALLLLPAARLAAQAPEAPPSSVEVAEVQRRAITPTVPVTGTVYSRNEVQITIGVDGQLIHVAEPGTRVAAGEELARIDTTPLELQLAEQRAQAARARAQLKFLDAQLKRQRNLASSNSLSANQLEQTEADREVASSDENIALARMRQIEDQLRRATVRAPFDGIVVERLRRGGEDVSRGTVVARLIDTESVEVRVYAPLRYAGRVRAGDELRLFAYESQQVGTVRTIVPAADMRSQSFELRIDLPAASEWVIGQLVSVAIPMRAARETLAVPRDALILRREGTYVFRVGDDETAQRIEVQTGDSAGDLVAVAGELREGDRVVVRGAETLSDGGKVAVRDERGAGGGTAAGR